MPLLNTVRAREVMREASVDVLIATGPSNVAYMSDYLCISHHLNPGVQIYGILPADETVPPGLVVPSLEVDAWAEQPGHIENISVYGTFHRDLGKTSPMSSDDQLIYANAIAGELKQDALQALIASLAQRGLTGATIGLDESNLSVNQWNALVEALPKARIVQAGAMFRKIRMVKTETEIQRMSRAAEITEQGIQHVFEQAREGITERELANQFKAHVSRLGGNPAFWVLSAGKRTAHTHPRQSDYPIRWGDQIKLDMGCTYQFYWSDVGRTKVLGEPGDEEQRIYQTLCEGLRAAIDCVSPGVPVSELFDVAVNTIRDLGIHDYERHHCGHGIGIEVYDLPLVQPIGQQDIYGMGEVDPTLEEGMVINLETPYYLLGQCGFIVEETVVVRETEAELLTRLDHSFTISA